MEQETKRVQQRLQQAMTQPRKQQKRSRMLPAIVAILFFTIVTALLWNELRPQTSATETELPPLSDTIFEGYVISSLYGDTRFLHKEQAAHYAAESYISNVALVAYGVKQGIQLTEEERAKKVLSFSTMLSSDAVAIEKQQRLAAMFQQQQVDQQALYAFAADVQLMTEKLLASYEQQGKEIDDVWTDSWLYYDQQAASEIEAFYAKHHISFSESSTYEIVSIPEEWAFMSSLQLTKNEQGHYTFVDGDQVVVWIEEQYGDVLYASAPFARSPFLFEPLFYKDYKENIQKLAQDEGEMQQRAAELLQVFTILEETYRDTYSFS